jgi:hypothetical protein
MLRHLANLPSRTPSVKESHAISWRIPVQRLSLLLASVNREDAAMPRTGWLTLLRTGLDFS